MTHTPHHHTLDWRPVGLSLGFFLSLSFVLCVVFDLIFPGMAMYESWMRLLPGFTWLSPGSFLLGMVESFGYGLYIALVFCPIYNFLAENFASRSMTRQ